MMMMHDQQEADVMAVWAVLEELIGAADSLQISAMQGSKFYTILLTAPQSLMVAAYFASMCLIP